jgi:hypothetical protein
MLPAVDVSPMVSIAFLLIGFFMIQANIRRPQVMPIVMPNDCYFDYGGGIAADERPVITLLLSTNCVYHYQGLTDAKLDSCDYSLNGLRRYLNLEQQKADLYFGPANDPSKTRYSVIVKVCRNACYKNFVDTIDELNICGIRQYSIIDITPEEERFICHPEKGLFFGPI